MRLEATALQKAVSTGNTLFPGQEERQTPRKETVASTGAPPSPAADTPIPRTSTPGPADQEAGNAPKQETFTTEPKKRTKPKASVQLPNNIQSQRQQALFDLGYTEDQISEIKPAVANFILDHKDTAVSELEQQLNDPKLSPGKRLILQELVSIKKYNERGKADPIDIKKPRTKAQEEKVEPVKKLESENQEEQPVVAKQTSGKEQPFNKRMTTSEIKQSEVTSENYKKINPLRVFGFSTNKKNPSVFNQPGRKVIGRLLDNRDLSNRTEEQKKAFNSLISFMQTFSKHLDSTFKPKVVNPGKGHDFRYQDGLNYFLEEGQKILPPEVKGAMAYAAFDWLATRAKSFNDTKDILRILNLPSSYEDTVATSKLADPIRDIGNKAIYLAPIIGQDVLKALQIRFPQQGNLSETAEEHLAASIGNNILATLQRMALVERNEINPGPKTDATTGLNGLARRIKGEHTEDITDLSMPTNWKEKKAFGLRASTFYVRAENPAINNLTSAYTELKPFLNQIFDLDLHAEEEFSFEEPKYSDEKTQDPLTKSDDFATEEQTTNRRNNEKIPYTIYPDIHVLLRKMSDASREACAGVQSIKGEHFSKHKGIEGKNRSIRRSFTAVDGWFKSAVQQPKKLATPFYIKSVFQATGRMRQIGSILPQGDKIHRALFSMLPAVVEIDPGNPKHAKLFMEGVGLSLDIEASKQDSVDAVIDETESLLQTDIMQAGLAAIDNAQSNKELSDQDQAAIVAAVKKGGEDLLTLRGLIEYAKFRKGKKFKTHIFMERDGMANGPFILSLQLRIQKISQEYLGRLMSMGMNFRETVNTGDHRLYDDPYVSIGKAMGKRLHEIKEELASGGYSYTTASGEVKRKELSPDQAVLENGRIDALSHILSDITEEEFFSFRAIQKICKEYDCWGCLWFWT